MKPLFNWGNSLLRVMLCAALFYGALGLSSHWALMWLAPVPILLQPKDISWRMASAEALLAYALGGLAWWPYLAGVIKVPAVIVVLAILQPAIAFAIAIGLAQVAKRRGRFAVAALVFPSVFVGYEWLLTAFSPHGSFGSVAYSQSDNLLVMQLLSVTGLSGITFLLCWLPAAVAMAWHRRHHFAEALRLLAPAVLVLGVALGWGWYRLATPLAGPMHKVALLADDAQLRHFGKTDQTTLDTVLHTYVQQIGAAANTGAQLIVLPEKAISLSQAQIPATQQQLQQLSNQLKVTLAVGVNVVGEVKRNLAWLFTPSIAAEAVAPQVYEKQHLVPGWESQYGAGEKLLTGSFNGLTLAVAICKDLDFPSSVGRYHGAQALIVPAWDFDADAWLHSRMAVARAIEQGVTLVRSAHDGRLTITDALGRVLAEKSTDASQAVALKAEVRFTAVDTVYGRFGDCFAWAVIGLLLWLLMVLWRGPAGARRDATN